MAMRVLCVNFGMGCGLPVGFRRPTEIGATHALGYACVGVVLPLASSPASDPFLWCYNGDFRL